MTNQPDSVEEMVEQLRPRVEWIPQSEQDYLQRQKLLPVFRGWLHQAWVAQKPHLIKAITQAKAEEREKQNGEWVLQIEEWIERLEELKKALQDNK